LFRNGVAYMLRIMASKTGFDKFLEQKLRDSAFREDFEVARAEIAATDALVRALESARAGRGITKAELARRISVKPEIVRRLLTDAGGNPTVGTVLKVAAALDYHLELVPNAGRRAARVPEAARRAHAATEGRTEARGTDTRPRASVRARSRAR
jgi:DNA-binding phage protein